MVKEKWEEGGVGGSVVNQGALLRAGTRKSGQGRAGTGPNDSSTTALYKYSQPAAAATTDKGL